MRTTVDLPEQLLTELQQTTEASSRREALIIALEDYLRRQRLRRVVAAAGELELDLDVRALRDAGGERLDG